jgi:hypothetical protein
MVDFSLTHCDKTVAHSLTHCLLSKMADSSWRFEMRSELPLFTSEGKYFLYDISKLFSSFWFLVRIVLLTTQRLSKNNEGMLCSSTASGNTIAVHIVCSRKICLIHCKNFCKCHNVPLPITTIIKKKKY